MVQTEHQLKKVKNIGLYDYVDPKRVLVSQATGFQKPEKEIFNLAAEQFDMNLQQHFTSVILTITTLSVPSMVAGTQCGLTTAVVA